MPHRRRPRRRHPSKSRSTHSGEPAVGFHSPLRPVGAGREIPRDRESRELDEYFRRMTEWERGEGPTLYAALLGAGFVAISPGALGDDEVSDHLWKMLQVLAGLGVYLHSTDHLSNRELYCLLWEESLQEQYVLMPGSWNYAVHVDMVGTGSEEDTRLYLRHYADQDTRQTWQQDFPEYVIPEHVDPPYDRDRFLPQPPSHGVHDPA